MIRVSTSLFAFAFLAHAAGQAPLAPAAPGQPATVAEARMLIERAKQELAQEEKSWSEEIAREKEAEGRRKQRLSEFTQDRQRLQQTLAEQDRKLKETMAKLEGHQLRERELQARFRRLGQTLASQSRAWRPDLAAGIPYRLDKRLETLDLLSRDLEGGNISPEEALNRFWAFQQSERRLAQEAEVYSGDFDGDGGDPIQVKYLRVGKQLMAFSSLDGAKLGMLRRMPDSAGFRYEWVREKDLDREARQAVKNAIATAEGKAVPGFVPVPVWRSAFAQSGAGSSPGAEAIPGGVPGSATPSRTPAAGPAPVGAAGTGKPGTAPAVRPAAPAHTSSSAKGGA